MAKVVLPHWLKEETLNTLRAQMHLARGLQARLVDHTRQMSHKTEVQTEAREVVLAVKALDAAVKALDTMCGGTAILKADADNMRHTMEFQAYCERTLPRPKQRAS